LFTFFHKFFDALGTPVRFEVTGKNPANLPQQLLQNAELAMALAQDPESRIKKDVLTKILVDASNMNSNETLYYSDEEWKQKQDQAQQMMQMQAMAAAQGAIGFAQVASIASQQFNGKGTTAPSVSSSIPAGVTPVANVGTNSQGGGGGAGQVVNISLTGSTFNRYF